MILSIESSCDDSSIAVTEIDSKRVLFHQKISQDEDHSIHGGVVPELASRLHARNLPKILDRCKEYLPHIKAVAVTSEPGLSVTLLEGVMMAKILSISLNIPLISINHLVGHIYSLFIESEEILPLSLLLISGGHTLILEIDSKRAIKVVAKSSDDSFGESFDKVGKMLDIGYPGGPIVEMYARDSIDSKIELPLPLKNKKELEFSFSGLKNATRVEILKIKKERGDELDKKSKSDICYSFQKMATEHLLNVTKRYFKSKKIENFAIVGGASANLYVRERFSKLCCEFDINTIFSDLKYCTDNAAMIGRAAIWKYQNREYIAHKNLKVSPRSLEINF